jgi:hypothetical protein
MTFEGLVAALRFGARRRLSWSLCRGVPFANDEGLFVRLTPPVWLERIGVRHFEGEPPPHSVHLLCQIS